jgi:hypothetical protein
MTLSQNDTKSKWHQVKIETSPSQNDTVVPHLNFIPSQTSDTYGDDIC